MNAKQENAYEINVQLVVFKKIINKIKYDDLNTCLIHSTQSCSSVTIACCVSYALIILCNYNQLEFKD